MTTRPDRQRGSAILSPGERLRRITAFTRLVRLMVHDDNNLLAAVESNVRSLAEVVPAGHAARHYMDNLERDAQFAKPRIGALQAYLEDGLATFEPVMASTLLDNLRAPVDQALPPACSAVFASAPSLPAVPMARPLVQRAARNAAHNACEDMAECGGTLHISAAMRHGSSAVPDDIFLLEYLRPEPMLCLEIANDGPSIDAQTREQLFDPGFSTRLRAPGLGLCAVLGTMLTHRGCIEVPLRPDGFTLRMLFPLKAPPRVARI